MQPAVSLPHSQVPHTCPYSEPDQSNRQHYTKEKNVTNAVSILIFVRILSPICVFSFQYPFFLLGESKSDLFSFPAFCLLNLNERLVPSLCSFCSRRYRASNGASVFLFLPLFISCLTI